MEETYEKQTGITSAYLMVIKIKTGLLMELSPLKTEIGKFDGLVKSPTFELRMPVSCTSI